MTDHCVDDLDPDYDPATGLYFYMRSAIEKTLEEAYTEFPGLPVEQSMLCCLVHELLDREVGVDDIQEEVQFAIGSHFGPVDMKINAPFSEDLQ